MSRLKHTPEGYLKFMQISEAAIFAFVEGRECDRYFYGKICRTACARHGLSYYLVSAEELPDEAGGKQSLIKFYQYLESADQLNQTFQGKNTAAVFFLDKDIDDLLGNKLVSPHLVYTETYDIEGSIFLRANIVSAIAVVAALDEQDISVRIPDSEGFRKSCAESSREWIELCIFCMKYSVKGCAGYRIHSPVNEKRTCQIDPAKLGTYVNKVKTMSGFGEADFAAKFTEVSELVNTTFSSGQHGKLFKGKWYTSFVEREVKSAAGMRQVDLRCLHAGLFSALQLTLNFNADWTDYFTAPIEKIILRFATREPNADSGGG